MSVVHFARLNARVGRSGVNRCNGHIVINKDNSAVPSCKRKVARYAVCVGVFQVFQKVLVFKARGDRTVHNCNGESVFVVAARTLNCRVERGYANFVFGCARNIIRVCCNEFLAVRVAHSENTREFIKERVLVNVIPIVGNFVCKGQEVFAARNIGRKVEFAPSLCTTDDDFLLRNGRARTCVDVGCAVIVYRVAAECAFNRFGNDVRANLFGTSCSHIARNVYENTCFKKFIPAQVGYGLRISFKYFAVKNFAIKNCHFSFLLIIIFGLRFADTVRDYYHEVR